MDFLSSINLRGSNLGVYFSGGGFVEDDGAGGLYFNSGVSIQSTGGGNFSYLNLANYGEGIYFVSGGSIIDDYGGSMKISGEVSFTEGIGLWNSASPGFQPATPTNLSDVISILQSYGLCS